MKPLFMPRRKTGLPLVPSIALLVAIAELVSAPPSPAQTPAYTVVELDAGQIPDRINNLGDLVGRTGSSGQTRATLWGHGKWQPQRLGALLGGDFSSAAAINDAREIVGASNTPNAIVPFIWKPIGGLQRIPLLLGDNCGQAFGINKSGHVVGYSSGPKGARAFLWTPPGPVLNLSSLPGGNSSRASAVNNSDQVVGTSASPAGDHAVLWTSTGQVRDLGVLPGDISSEAVAINNAGEVVGYSKGPKRLRAFLWTAATGMQNLGVLPGGDASRALDINDSGNVVGSSASSSGDRAFIWTKQAGMTDLNSAASASLGVLLVEAHAINSTGEILAMGKATPSEETDAPADHGCSPAPPSTFLLIPTPAQ